MKIEHVSDYIGLNNECFKVTSATIDDFEELGNQFSIVDAWAVNNSKVNIPQASQIGEFDFYLLLDSKNSMLFKLAYLHDK